MKADNMVLDEYFDEITCYDISPSAKRVRVNLVAFCDCLELHVLLGGKITLNHKYKERAEFKPTEVVDKDFCKHCGYRVFWERKPMKEAV